MSISDYRSRLKYILEDRPIYKSHPSVSTSGGPTWATSSLDDYTPYKYHLVDFDDYLGFVKCSNKLAMYNTGNYPYYPNTYISLQIHDPISSEPLYIPMFDCDTEADRAVVSYHLKHVDKRPYFTMISTNKTEEDTIERSWIFVDQIGPLDDVIRYMHSIKAGDVRYKVLAEKKKILVVRAYPKGMFIPKQATQWGEAREGTLGRMLGTFKYTEPFQQWLNDFLDYWESDLIKEIITNKFVEAL